MLQVGGCRTQELPIELKVAGDGKHQMAIDFNKKPIVSNTLYVLENT